MAASDRLIAAVKTVIIADLVMSIDNVIGVAGAAKGSLMLLVFGLVVSIPLVVVGSQLIMKLVERMPWLVIAGGGLLGYIAGEIAIEDVTVKPWITANAPWLHYAAPIAGVAARRRRRLVAHAPPSARRSPLTDAVRQIQPAAAGGASRRALWGSASLSQQWQRPVKLAA